MIIDLGREKVEVWKQPGRWGERLTMRKSVSAIMEKMNVGQSVVIEGAFTMTGANVNLSVVQSYAYTKNQGKLFATKRKHGQPLTITRIA